MTDAAGTRSFGYDPATLAPVTETLAGLVDAVVTRTYETAGVPGRPEGFQVDAGHQVSWGYEPATGRLASVWWSVDATPDSASYTYLADSDLPDTRTLDGDVVTTYAYEPGRNLLTRVKHEVGATRVAQHDYTYNALGQRASATRSGRAYAEALNARLLGQAWFEAAAEHRQRRRASARLPGLRLRPHRQPHRGRREGPGHGDAAAHGLHGQRPEPVHRGRPAARSAPAAGPRRGRKPRELRRSRRHLALHLRRREPPRRGRAPEPHHRGREAGASLRLPRAPGAEGRVHLHRGPVGGDLRHALRLRRLEPRRGARRRGRGAGRPTSGASTSRTPSRAPEASGGSWP